MFVSQVFTTRGGLRQLYTFNDILERLTNAIKTKETLIEGFFTMTNLRAVAQEFNIAYAYIKYVEGNYALSSATDAFLDMRASDYGITRKSATFATGRAVIKGSDGVTIPAGTILTGAGRYSVINTSRIIGGQAIVEIEALEAGAAGNVQAGAINKLETEINGVQSVINEMPLSGGSDLETDDELRSRVYQKIRNPITSGNANHYKIWASSVDGVGKVKVFPLWNGAGTVKVSILGGDNRKATSELVQKVQAYIDPVSRTGAGQAPVGALVTVSTATEKAVNISATLTLSSAVTADEVRRNVRRVIYNYIAALAYSETTTLSMAQVGHLIMSVVGVLDYSDLKINGKTDTLEIGAEEILIFNSTTFNGTYEGEYDASSDIANGIVGSGVLPI